MRDIIFDNFQNSVNDSLLRHRNILDILSKYQESQARASRAVCKAVTNCGCIKVSAEKQDLIYDENYLENLNTITSGIEGQLCDNCREVIERELGNNMFYFASLCNALGLNLYDIYLKEYDKMNTLGKFTLR